MADKPGRLTLARVLPWILLIGGSIGVLASAILTDELFNILKNPHYVPVCNLNPIISCSSVTTSAQAHAFGFPNEFIGLAGYAAVATVGAALLAGARFKGWFWRLVNGGLLFAVGFVTWLQFETLYRIGALCIFCMITWLVTIPAFWYTTLYNLREGHIKLPARFTAAGKFAAKHHGDILLVWFLIIIVLILKRFWYYFGNL
ncbi:MAG: Vitamin epoxide reductase [Candidatus Saccharibacteria bacterium]|nr:Vitamin epoxide reductase [Candidatus Saccharibacteria bacterium]